MIIRAATPQDENDIRNCVSDAYAPSIQRIGKKPAPMNANILEQIEAGHIYVAVIKTSILGYITFYPKADHILLESVAVLRTNHNQGIGKALINYCERFAIERGYSLVTLYTHILMTENIALYRRLGYQDVKQEIQDGFKRVFFEKALPHALSKKNN